MCRLLSLSGYFCILLLLHLLGSLDDAAAEQPNVLVILTDDQGWGDLSLNGNQNLDTPHIDSLARDGASFDRFFVQPVCSPTRAEFLTGRYHVRSGVYGTSLGGERMNLDEVTIADTFRKAGYATGAFGKWHNGMQYPYHPNGRGFDEFYGFCSGHWGDYFSPPLEHNGRLVQGEGFCIDDFTNKAIEFMQDNIEAKKPFLAYLAYNTPHSPMQVPDKYWDRFKDKSLTMHHRDPEKEQLEHIRCALAMCENLDWNVGRLLAKLDEWEIADDTIVCYFSDNGPNGFRWNGDMLGRKGSTDEGGVRSPLLVRWPGQVKAGKRIKPIAGAIDLLPTLTELAGVRRFGKKALDGQSLVSLLLTDTNTRPDRNLVSFWNNKVSVRSQRYRFGQNGRLFDMENDPGQRRDISGKEPKLTERLRKVSLEFQTKIAAGYDQDDRPFVIGHPNFKYTQVPARDATGSGNIKRSSRHPNCSFLTNWTRTDEEIFWDVEVGATGNYQVELQYTCAKENLGSTIELTFLDNRLTAVITEAHDPPLQGMENDRFPRIESYVKNFLTINLGTIRLTEGKGKLRIRAIDIPGKNVMDFRLLLFKRVLATDQ